MSQHDYNIANQSKTAFRADLNNVLAAILSRNSGSTSPSTTTAFMTWPDTASSLLKRRNAADSGWIVEGSLDETFLVSRTSNTILGLSDYGKMISATGTFTQTLTAAATLGDGWRVFYRNDGTGIITLDPNSSEQIDGATTQLLYPGESCLIYCNGSAFKTTGRVAASSFASGTFSKNLADASTTQDITTIGWPPSLIFLLGGNMAINNTGDSISIGFFCGSVQRCATCSGSQWALTDLGINLLASGSFANQQNGTISTLSNGFRITWGKANSPTGTAPVAWLAIR